MPTVIAGAEVYDGTGGPPFVADVAIADGRIAAVGADLHQGGAAVVDGTGMALSPGFVDFHSHADFTLPAYPEAVNSLSQGVTAEVLGNCGASPAPLSADPDRRAAYRALHGMLGPDLDWSWTSFGEYLGALDAARPAVHCLPLVGHGAVRAAVMGGRDEPPTPAELEAMRGLVAEAMAAGAWGMSTGLVYPPSSYGQPEEIHMLAAVVGAHGGIYASHMRSEESRLAEAIAETVAVAAATGVTTEISHLKSSGVANHGRIGEALEAIAAAGRQGLDVGHDAYPYPASSTALSQVLPAWALVGGVEAIAARLASAETRRRIRDEMEADPDGFLRSAGGWGGIMISGVDRPALKHYEGRRVDGLARDRGEEPADLVFDLIVADRGATAMIAFTMADEDVAAAVGHPDAVIGSDQFGVTGPDARVHPRAYGTFARMLAGAAVTGPAGLSDVIRRMTSLPAARLGLAGRGTIAVGNHADVVLFDPGEVHDRATFTAPAELAAGIARVYVAGALAYRDGERVGPGRGRVLRSCRDRT